jgi:surface carbohydrate biosynthesis protein
LAQSFKSLLNLYIPVEVKNRELHGKVLLAVHAARRGFNVILGPKNELNNLILLMPPGIYFGIGAFENFGDFYAKLKRLGFFVVVNEEEGLVTYSDKMYVDMRVSDETLSHVDEFYTWGNENQNILTQAFPSQSEKFYVTGNPRFDLLKAQYRCVYDGEINDIKGRYGRFVLVCTSFSSINHFDRNLDYLRSLVEKKTLRSPESIKNFKRYREVKVKTLSSFLDAIPIIAAENPSVNIVVRPHPSENPDIYRDLENNYRNIFVDSRFSVHPWIIASEALIHHYCTTSVEALAAGTPRFALRPVKDRLSEKEVPFDCSTHCGSVDEIVAEIGNCIKVGKTNWESILPERDYTWYVSNLRESVASDAIVSRIVSSQKCIETSNDWFKTTFAVMLYALKKSVRSVLPRANRRRYLDHKFSNFSVNEIENMLASFDAYDVDCKRYAKDFIQIKANCLSQDQEIS